MTIFEQKIRPFDNGNAIFLKKFFRVGVEKKDQKHSHPPQVFFGLSVGCRCAAMRIYADGYIYNTFIS